MVRSSAVFIKGLLIEGRHTLAFSKEDRMSSVFDL